MVITPAYEAQQFGITFQWPSQRGHQSKQADTYLAIALQHGCADGLTDALKRLGWGTSTVSVSVTHHRAFWLVDVRHLLTTHSLACKQVHEACVAVLCVVGCGLI